MPQNEQTPRLALVLRLTWMTPFSNRVRDGKVCRFPEARIDACEHPNSYCLVICTSCLWGVLTTRSVVPLPLARVRLQRWLSGELEHPQKLESQYTNPPLSSKQKSKPHRVTSAEQEHVSLVGGEPWILSKLPVCMDGYTPSRLNPNWP
ncbi:uncharacterized protein CIMG_00275 [Coccidioides immitis RS]|uniref:Uncharacterized protein n=2 Tax=Coccidioides immitis TaxID=5501 RepID=J3KGN6_COCIM|nr:uncharacterized protein CIMG_00275 [Coccidioides immitis RS]EAS34921.3 hypothetical protein CIMG_00275 [Coccidioides immitis RS]